MTLLVYKRNKAGTLQAAHSGSVRVGYIEQGNAEHRWLWSLNTIQPLGGRASGIEETEDRAKGMLTAAWVAWISAAGLHLKEQQDDLQDRDGFRATGEG